MKKRDNSNDKISDIDLIVNDKSKTYKEKEMALIEKFNKAVSGLSLLI